MCLSFTMNNAITAPAGRYFGRNRINRRIKTAPSGRYFGRNRINRRIKKAPSGRQFIWENQFEMPPRWG
jgi:hypothetical protein